MGDQVACRPISKRHDRPSDPQAARRSAIAVTANKASHVGTGEVIRFPGFWRPRVFIHTNNLRGITPPDAQSSVRTCCGPKRFRDLTSVEPPEEGQGPLIEGGCNHRHWRAPVRTEHVTKCWFSEHTHSSLEAGDSVVAGEGTCVVRGSSSLSRFAGSVNTELSISVSGLL